MQGVKSLGGNIWAIFWGNLPRWWHFDRVFLREGAIFRGVIILGTILLRERQSFGGIFQAGGSFPVKLTNELPLLRWILRILYLVIMTCFSIYTISIADFIRNYGEIIDSGTPKIIEISWWYMFINRHNSP